MSLLANGYLVERTFSIRPANLEVKPGDEQIIHEQNFQGTNHDSAKFSAQG
jgi:hypothetical protein